MKLLTVILRILLPAAALALLGAAQEPPKPAPEPAKPAAEAPADPAAKAEVAPAKEAGEPLVSGSVDVGYRFRTGIAGNSNAYRTVVDLGEGPKLFGFDLRIQSHTRKYFDKIKEDGKVKFVCKLKKVDGVTDCEKKYVGTSKYNIT